MEMGGHSLWGKGLNVNGWVDIPVIVTPGSESPQYPRGHYDSDPLLDERLNQVIKRPCIQRMFERNGIN